MSVYVLYGKIGNIEHSKLMGIIDPKTFNDHVSDATVVEYISSFDHLEKDDLSPIMFYLMGPKSRNMDKNATKTALAQSILVSKRFKSASKTEFVRNVITSVPGWDWLKLFILDIDPKRVNYVISKMTEHMRKIVAQNTAEQSIKNLVIVEEIAQPEEDVSEKILEYFREDVDTGKKVEVEDYEIGVSFDKYNVLIAPEVMGVIKEEDDSVSQMTEALTAAKLESELDQLDQNNDNSLFDTLQSLDALMGDTLK